MSESVYVVHTKLGGFAGAFPDRDTALGFIEELEKEGLWTYPGPELHVAKVPYYKDDVVQAMADYADRRGV